MILGSKGSGSELPAFCLVLVLASVLYIICSMYHSVSALTDKIYVSNNVSSSYSFISSAMP